MDTSAFNPVSIYAAVVSTAVALWNIFIWRRSGPVLRGSLSANMSFIGMGPMDDETYIIFDVNNVGGRSTTITNIGLLGYASLWTRLRGKAARAAVINSGLNATYPVPHELKPGSNFRASAIQNEELIKWSHDMRLYGVVYHNSGKPLMTRLLPITESEKSKARRAARATEERRA